ncbi:hypothetical protein RM780_14020, partial [Streptomyces sp. DSM 44917]
MQTRTGPGPRHGTEAEALLERAVGEEVRRSGGRLDGERLLRRARAALPEILRPAAEEYAAYAQAEAAAAPGRLADRYSGRALA